MIRKTITSIALSALALFGAVGLTAITPTFVDAQTPPAEPICQAITSNPTFNPFPITSVLPNPDYTPGDCKDMPLISFYPIRTQENNPRNLTFIEGQPVRLQLYYNNGAQPGSPAIQNPTLGVQAVRVSETTYRISATLSGSNTATVTSAQKGGDLIATVPAGTELDIVGNTTLHYPDAVERQYQASTTGARPYDQVPDNTTGSEVSNPIFTEVTGKTIPTAGFNLKPQGLEAGFLGYGFVLTQLVARPAQVNTPPSMPGQEITIIRGDAGSFQPYSCTDPENNVPCTYTTNNLLPFCTLDQGSLTVRCQTDAQTPVRSTFTVTPTDSLGLTGNPATFIVNVIEPGLNITKDCVERGTTTPCETAQLLAGDEVTYTVSVTNTGNAPARNAVVVDDYDQTRLENVININPAGQLNTTDGTITWNYAEITPQQTLTMTFDATVSQNAKDGDIILNVATVSADGIPEKRAEHRFPVGAGAPLLATSDKTCVRLGTNTPCASAGLKVGEKVLYSINVRNTGTIAANNVTVTDTYDSLRLTTIGNINPNGQLNTSNGTINWAIPTVGVNETVTLTFEATISQNAQNGDIIVNTALIRVPGLPDNEVQVEFPINRIVVTPQTPTSGGAQVILVLLGLGTLGAGGYLYYKNRDKNSKAFVPKRKSEAKIK